MKPTVQDAVQPAAVMEQLRPEERQVKERRSYSDVVNEKTAVITRSTGRQQHTVVGAAHRSQASMQEVPRVSPPRPSQHDKCHTPQAASHSQRDAPTAAEDFRPGGPSAPSDLLELFLPLLFAAFRAILRNKPASAGLPEVQAVLAFVPLFTRYFPQCAASSTHDG